MEDFTLMIYLCVHSPGGRSGRKAGGGDAEFEGAGLIHAMQKMFGELFTM